MSKKNKKEKEYKLAKEIGKRVEKELGKSGFEWAIEQQDKKIIITPMHKYGIVIHGRKQAKFFCKLILECFQ